MLYSKTFQDPRGLGVFTVACRVVPVDGAKQRGDVVMFDLAQSNPATVTSQPGVEGSSLVNVIAPAAAALGYGIFAVMLKAANQGQEAPALLCGRGFVRLPAGLWDPGDLLAPVNGSGVMGAPNVDGQKVTAIVHRRVVGGLEVDFSGQSPVFGIHTP